MTRFILIGTAFVAAAAAVLALPAVAGAQGVPITDLSFLPGDRAVAPASGDQSEAVIAPGGPGALIVWTDERTTPGMPSFSGGPYFEPEYGNHFDIYATRIDGEGHVLDAQPIIVSNASYGQVKPRVAWNGTHWLVVFTSEREAYFWDDLVAVRVAPDGTVVDQTPIAIRRESFADPAFYGYSVTSDGNNWFVSWITVPAGTVMKQARGSLITAAGTVVTPQGVLFLQRDTFGPSNTSVHFAGDEYLLLVDEDIYPTKAFRLARDLTKIAGPFSISTMSVYPPSSGVSVASSGGQYLLAWEYYDGSWTRIFGTRLTATGTVLDPDGILIRDYSYAAQFFPRVAWDGTNYQVAYTDLPEDAPDEGVVMKRVSTAGAVIDSTPIVVANPAGRQVATAASGVAGGGARYVWEDTPPGSNFTSDIVSASVGPDGSPRGDAATMSLGLPKQFAPDMVPNGSGHLAVFRSDTSTRTRIMAQRLDRAGIAIDAEPFEVASGDFGSIGGAKAAWDGTRYLVVWPTIEGGTGVIRARRIAADGTFLDTPFTAMDNASMPDVAGKDGLFMVCGSHAVTHHIFDAHIARVRGGDGTVLDSTSVRVGTSFVLDSRIAPVGDRFLVVWEHQSTHDHPPSSIEGNWVTREGVPGTEFRVNVTGAGYGDDPEIAASPDRAAVIWYDNSDPSNTQIDARVINADGSFRTGEISVSAAPGQQFAPAVACDGAQFIAAWEDNRDVAYLDQLRPEIFAARITPEGVVVDPDGIRLSETVLGEMGPALSSAEGRTVVGYAAYEPDEPANYRLGLRVMGDSSSECLPDCTQDGKLNINDFICFQSEWRKKSTYGDYNGDGKWNVNDFLAFQADFRKGCP